ncbi:uncharacterized protein PG986_011106 [Apiospora aurea]|uniref:Secreted protein n=1 Tax=Apiospora aurea TaxID=335848 RepID=A0ABR1Q470_9PEZI
MSDGNLACGRVAAVALICAVGIISQSHPGPSTTTMVSTLTSRSSPGGSRTTEPRGKMRVIVRNGDENSPST